MGLPLTIAGDTAGIRNAAEWLDPDLRNALVDADLELSYMVGEASYQWTGESGTAFGSASQAIRRGNFAARDYPANVAEVMRAYAGRLERGADDFEGYASWAVRKGLTVWSNVIQYPTTWLSFCPDPDGEDSPELREWNKYQEKVQAYNEVSAKVGSWWGDLEVWIAEQFSQLVADIETLQEGNAVYEGLVKGNEEVVGLALEYADARHARDLATFRQQVSSLQQKADLFQTQLRSGNPALKAAAELADPRGMRQAARALNEMIEGVSRAGKIIPVIGTVIDIVATGAEIANGGSESSAIVGLVGGIGGAGIGVAIVAGVALPPVGVAIVVAGASWAVGEAATMAWEAWVPLDTRESIDAGIEDFLDFINPVSWFVDAP